MVMFNKSIRKIFKDQSGMALSMALILMIAATFIVVPGLWATGSMIKVNQGFTNDTLAYYAAKSGIEDVFWAFGNNAMATRPLTGSGYKLANQVNGMDVWVKEENLVGHTYYISSTAKLNGNSLRTVYASLNVDLTGGYPFKYAIASREGDVNISSNSQIKYIPNSNGLTADVWANGNLNVAGLSNVTIDGKGYYTGSVSGCNVFTVQPCVQSAQPYPFQTLDLTWYWSEAKKGIAWGGSMPGSIPAPYYGTTTYTLTQDTTTLGGVGYTSYIAGNLDLNAKKVILKGVVWVNGYITSTKNSASIQTDQDYPLAQYYLVANGMNTADSEAILYKNGIIDANGNLNFVAINGGVDVEAVFGPSATAAKLGVIFAPNGNVFLKGNASGARPQAGAIYGKSVTINSNVDIYYNTALQQNPIGGYKLNVTTIKMNEFGG